jgi:hypothetical protein
VEWSHRTDVSGQTIGPIFKGQAAQEEKRFVFLANSDNNLRIQAARTSKDGRRNSIDDGIHKCIQVRDRLIRTIRMSRSAICYIIL